MQKSWYRWKRDSLELRVRIQTRTKHDEIAGFHGNAIHIRLRAAPVDGKANAQLVRFLAQAFDVPKSHVEIVRGTHSSHKTLVIAAPQQIPPDLVHKLRFPPG